MKLSGLIIDNSPHYLDHLAPLCALLNCPLIICEEAIGEQCRRFYPQVRLVETNFQHLELPPCILSCASKPQLLASLGPLKPWNSRLIWLPHGLSDKGWKTPFFEALGGEDLLLVYGQRMRDVLASKGVRLPCVSLGNFRFHFYQMHRPFYDQMVQTLLGSQRFILYAPTWDDFDQNGTFWETFPHLLGAVPAERHLLIKLHPNTEAQFGPELERCRGLLAPHPNISLLESFPPIYPLLARTDAYIGDMSSIGYDFLHFNKPLFFLQKNKTDPQSLLMQCGEQISFGEIARILQAPLPPAKPSQWLIDYAFDKVPSCLFFKRLLQYVGRGVL